MSYIEICGFSEFGSQEMKRQVKRLLLGAPFKGAKVSY
jgi:hypothetical protein